jgi:hypothetical protein
LARSGRASEPAEDRPLSAWLSGADQRSTGPDDAHGGQQAADQRPRGVLVARRREAIPVFVSRGSYPGAGGGIREPAKRGKSESPSAGPRGARMLRANRTRVNISGRTSSGQAGALAPPGVFGDGNERAPVIFRGRIPLLLARYSGWTCTRRNFTTPDAYCRAIGPSACLSSFAPSTVRTPLSVTVNSGPLAVIS